MQIFRLSYKFLVEASLIELFAIVENNKVSLAKKEAQNFL